MLLMDALLDDYTRSWENNFAAAFDRFRENLTKAKLTRNDDVPNEYWLRYGQQTRVNSDRADTIQRRHEFFAYKMREELHPVPKDPRRKFGKIERELIYHRDEKLCAVCRSEVLWEDALAPFLNAQHHCLSSRTRKDLFQAITHLGVVGKYSHPY